MQASVNKFLQLAQRLCVLINLYLEECAFHANLNHNLDVFVCEGRDVRVELQEESERLAKRLRPCGIKVGEVTASGGI